MKLFYLFVLAACLTVNLQAAYTVKDGKLVNKATMATLSVQEHFSAAMDAYEKENWEELIHQMTILVKNFSTTAFAQEADFYLGVAHFHRNDLELANKQLSAYLKKQVRPKHFDETIEYKFAIAEKFHGGAKKHLMGWEKLPQWLPAQDEALAIYDEVVMALPHHDLAARALFGKAKLLFAANIFRQSVDAYQTLIRRFPKHALAPESYLGIASVYLAECQAEYPDPDFLDLAQINLRKFRQDFPGEERIALGEKMLLDMQEIYAENLYETGRFFERTKKPKASAIYYNKIINKYPETKVAALSKRRLGLLKIEKEETAPLVEETPE
jgi:outer membrane protein assembly factor BamD (BamD/ComL family)